MQESDMARFPRAFTTERLVLRRVTPDDAHHVFSYARDPEVARFMTFPRAERVDDVIAPFLDRVQASMDADTEFHWGIRPAAESRLIGVISLMRRHGLEMGYVLNRSQWGRGYVPEAAGALIDWAFDTREAWRVWATCDLENTKSVSVMRKIGMAEEGVLRRWMLHPNIADEPRDCYVFSIVR